MLEFMRDEKSDNSLPKGEKPDIDAGEVNNTGSGAGSDYLVPAEHGRNVRQSTIILAVLFSIGVLCLWFMIKKVAPKAVSAAIETQEAQIENAIAKVTGIETEMNGRIDSVIDKFYKFSDVDQIDVDDLIKNPFIHNKFSDAGQEDFDLDNATLKQELLRKSKQLQLWSVMKSSQGSCCMINEKILYLGDTINGFKVSRIESRSVELVANDLHVILKMSE